MYQSDATKAIFFQTGAYDDIGVRSLSSTNYTTGVAAAMAEHTDDGKKITPETLAPIASDVLQLKTETCGRANIINGMDTKRFRYLLEFTEVSGLRTAGKTRTVFTGYTDYVGVTPNNTVDFNMRMYLNNAVQLRETIQETPAGPRVSVNISYANQILHNPAQGVGLSGPAPLLTLRPEDIFALMQYENQAEFAQLANAGMVSANQLTTTAASARNNLNPAVYLSNTMNAFKSGMIRAEAEEEFDLGVAYESAREHVRVPITGSRVSVMRTIASKTNFLTNGFVTYGELCSLFPSLNHIADFKLVSSINQAKMYQPGQGANWFEVSDNAWLASQLQMSVPAIMNDNMLQFMHLFVTNDTINGVWDIRPVQPGKSLVQGLDQTKQLQNCMNRIVNEVLKPITQYGLMKITLDLKVDLFGDATFAFNFDNRGNYMYTAPAFCDALYSAMLTTDTKTLTGLKRDLETMLMDLDGSASKLAMDKMNLQKPQFFDPSVNLNQAVDLQHMLNNTTYNL